MSWYNAQGMNPQSMAYVYVGWYQALGIYIAMKVLCYVRTARPGQCQVLTGGSW